MAHVRGIAAEGWDIAGYKIPPALSCSQTAAAVASGSALFLGLIAAAGGVLALITVTTPKFTAFKYLASLKMDGAVALLVGGAALTAGGAVASCWVLVLWRKNVPKVQEMILAQSQLPSKEWHVLCGDVGKMPLDQLAAILKKGGLWALSNDQLDHLVHINSRLTPTECDYLLQTFGRELALHFHFTKSLVETTIRDGAFPTGYDAEKVALYPKRLLGWAIYPNSQCGILRACDVAITKAESPELKARLERFCMRAKADFETLRSLIRDAIQDPAQPSVLRKLSLIESYRLDDVLWTVQDDRVWASKNNAS